MFWRIPNLLGEGPLEFILDKESFTLEELLDEEEIIQECKALNTRLINFLRDRAQVEQLLQYIIEEPPEDADSKRSIKFPFIACEIFTCEIDVILKTLVEDDDLMKRLFAFLEPDRAHNPTLAGYFSKVVVCLMFRKTTSLVTYVQTHEAIFHQLVDLIGITSIMEILIRFVSADDHAYPNSTGIMQWLADTDLLEMIVDKLSFTHSSEVNANAAEVLISIIRNAPSALATELSSQRFVERIFSHALENSSSKSGLVHSLSVCIALLDPRRFMSPAFHYMGSQHFYEPRSHVDLETLHAMLTQLDNLLKLLNVSSDAITLPTTYGELHPPLGKHRLKVVEFIAVLVEAGSEAVEKKLIHSRAIHIVLDLFFKYPFNNSLHHYVENLIMSCLESKNIAIVDHLFCECGIIAKFLQADKNSLLPNTSSAVIVPLSGRQPIRAGYIGHITRICNKIVQLGKSNNHVWSYLQDSEWVSWQTNILSERNAVENVFRWACGRPTSLQDRTRDSDEEEVQDKDYDIKALDNNSSEAFRYHGYENDGLDEAHVSLDRENEDAYENEGSAGVVISALRTDGDNQNLFTNSNWFTFVDETPMEPTSISTLDSFADIILNETSSSGDSSDDEVVVGVEELTKNANPEGEGTGSSADSVVTDRVDESHNAPSAVVMKLNDADVNIFQFNAAENEDLFNDQQQPDWVGWREASDIEVDGSPDLTTHSNSEGTAVSTESVSTLDALADDGTMSASVSNKSAEVEEPTKPCSFEEDAEFVGVDFDAGRDMNGEVTATKRNFVLEVPDLPEPRGDGTTIMEFRKNHWRMEPEVGVVQE